MMYMLDLNHYFRAKAIILIGASDTPDSIGQRVWQNILAAPFSGKTSIVNIKHKIVGGLEAHHNILKAPEAELAVVLTPVSTYDNIFKACQKHHTSHLLLIQDWENLAENQIRQAQTSIRKAAQSGLFILSCSLDGIISNTNALHSSAYPALLPKGSTTLITHHDSSAGYLKNLLEQKQIGINQSLTLHPHPGSIQVATLLDHFSGDSSTQTLIVHLPPFAYNRTTVSALRQAAREKTLITYTPSHDNLAVFQHLAQRFGWLHTHHHDSLAAALSASQMPARKQTRLAILANGEQAEATAGQAKTHQLPFATFSNETQQQLTQFPSASISGSVLTLPSNPSSTAFRSAAQTILTDNNTDAVIVTINPTLRRDHGQTADLLSKLPTGNKSLLLCHPQAERHPLQFQTTDEALRTLAASQQHKQYRQPQIATPLTEMPAPPDIAAAEALIRTGAESAVILQALALPAYTPDSSPEPLLHLILKHHPQFGAILHAGYTSPDPAGWLAIPPFNTLHAAQIIKHFHLNSSHTAHLGGLLIQLSAIAAGLQQLETLHLTVTATNKEPLCFHTRSLALNPFLAAVPTLLAPYPDSQTYSKTLQNNLQARIRPVRPEDAEITQNFTRNLSEQSRQNRFMSPLKQLNATMLARFSQLDYDREAAFIMTNAQNEPLAFARYTCRQFPQQAEFGISVHDQYQGLGISTIMMQLLIEQATAQGYLNLYGEILQSNHAMLGLANKLGFIRKILPQDPKIAAVTLPLKSPTNNIVQKQSNKYLRNYRKLN